MLMFAYGLLVGLSLFVILIVLVLVLAKGNPPKEPAWLKEKREVDIRYMQENVSVWRQIKKSLEKIEKTVDILVE